MHPLHPHHARELEASGIAPETVAQRGSRSVTAAECAALGFAPYQCGDGLLLPMWTLGGVQRGHKLKRDAPRIDKDGKIVKYEFPEGGIPAFDVHPAVRHLLREVDIDIYFTEGIKKGDALASRGALCIDIGSVWMFLNRKLVVPDLDDIPLDGRLARIVFDSDLASKPSVAEALLRFAAALYRRGARVEVVQLPHGPDGAKTGVDDFLAAGNTITDLDALARPWTGEGPGVRLRSTDETDADELRRQRDQARADVRAIVGTILNPHVSRQELIAAVSVATNVRAKQQRGDVEPDGTVVLSAADISDDWRQAPAKGERVAPTNPSGDRPRLARDRVKPIITAAIDRGLIRARPRPALRKHANGTMYKDTDWVLDPMPSITAALDPWATYRPAAPTPRKPRETAKPCPACGEVHPIRRTDACTGCGAIRAETTIAPDARSASDKSSEAKTGDVGGPSPAPYVYLSDKSSEADMGAGLAWNPGDPGPFDGTDAPPLAAAQAAVTAADSARDPAAFRHARDDLSARLAASAREHGRAPVPKPTLTPMPTPLAGLHLGAGAFPTTPRTDGGRCERP